MKKRILFLFIVLCLFYTGCGKNQKLEEYNENIRLFTENVADISTRMNAIDTTSEAAAQELLSCLDEMNSQFLILAEMNVPKEFASVEDLANEASAYMTEAVTLYHEVFEAEEFSEDTASVAKENYDRAMKRISYISTLLQGELPEGSDVIVTEEEALDFEPVTEE